MSKKVKVAIITTVGYIIVALIQQSCLMLKSTKPEKIPDETMTPEETEMPLDTVKPLENKTLESPMEVEIRELTPLIGHDEDFWGEASEEDNMGDGSYTMSIFCIKDNKTDITYPVSKKYSAIKGDLALASSENDIEVDLYVEFYNGKRCIGRTERITAGVRPISFEYDIGLVNDLRIEAKSSDSKHGAKLLTHGFLLVPK